MINYTMWRLNQYPKGGGRIGYLDLVRATKALAEIYERRIASLETETLSRQIFTQMQDQTRMLLEMLDEAYTAVRSARETTAGQIAALEQSQLSSGTGSGDRLRRQIMADLIADSKNLSHLEETMTRTALHLLALRSVLRDISHHADQGNWVEVAHRIRALPDAMLYFHEPSV